MKIEIITQDDLFKLKEDILAEIRALNHSNSTNEQGKVWLKSAEVRRLLGISPGTLQNLRVTGTLPYRKIGGTIYYRRDDVDTMMENGSNDHNGK
ncbi:Helix-turn-helix domain-containing protein [Sinomicrobium oceani]|uniref:Helix-turn-helix domain-containing protein n=1 Tax=Sinomicrobium oceani TaxID=1150368 RepID=A0A1K1QRM6_9FLAO|nr:helix-turn-helix domain-containing protein [Sinomicrobium oceani]SFW62345.1 Helix-turn-helix domain-containing protein [Sinomicrobium oceani]